MKYSSTNQELKRSPLKMPALPQAGQSTVQRIDTLIEKKRLDPALMAIVATVWATFEWVRWLFSLPPAHIHLTIIAVGLWFYAFVQMRGSRDELHNLRLGRDGEQVVAEELERLRALGYEVFHDICCDGFNIDHVLVGPGGVFTIETKTRIKPVGRESKVTYDGTVIRVDGHIPERDPVSQAKGQASWLRTLIKSTTGENVKIRPIVVFPGWYVDSPGNRDSEVWVLNESGLIAFVRNEYYAMPSNTVSLIAHHLRLHIQHAERQVKAN